MIDSMVQGTFQLKIELRVVKSLYSRVRLDILFIYYQTRIEPHYRDTRVSTRVVLVSCFFVTKVSCSLR